jgi:hypothetical protein
VPSTGNSSCRPMRHCKAPADLLSEPLLGLCKILQVVLRDAAATLGTLLLSATALSHTHTHTHPAASPAPARTAMAQLLLRAACWRSASLSLATCRAAHTTAAGHQEKTVGLQLQVRACGTSCNRTSGTPPPR